MKSLIPFISLLIIGAQLHAYEHVVERSFSVQGPGQLTIDADRGNVSLEAEERDTVAFEIHYQLKGFSDDEAQALFDEILIGYEQSENDIIMILELPEDQKFSLFNFWKEKPLSKARIHIKVKAPLDFKPKIDTKGGNITISRINNEVRAHTLGGNINLKTITGNMYLDTMGGNIIVEDSRGTIVADTKGGNISIDRAIGLVDAETMGGNVTARIEGGLTDNCRLKTMGGDVTVFLDESIQANLSAHTMGGRVVAHIPVSIEGKVKKNKLKGKLNEGGPDIDLNTMGGNIHIKAL